MINFSKLLPASILTCVRFTLVHPLEMIQHRVKCPEIILIHPIPDYSHPSLACGEVCSMLLLQTPYQNPVVSMKWKCWPEHLYFFPSRISISCYLLQH